MSKNPRPESPVWVEFVSGPGAPATMLIADLVSKIVALPGASAAQKVLDISAWQ